MLDICCIGHITLDKIITPSSTAYLNGGTSYYVAHALAQLPPLKFKLLTSLDKSQMPAVEAIRAKGIDVDVVPSRATVFFENKYGHNFNNRKQRVLAKADPFTLDKVKDVEAKYIHLGSLLADDFPLEVAQHFAGKCILSVDAQGFLRYVDGENVIACDWDNKLEWLKIIDIRKGNEHEGEALTGHKDLRLAAKQLSDWGVKEVVITLGSYGSVVYCNGYYCEIPPFSPLVLADATGCGDTYMTGYLYKRAQGASIWEAGLFASAMSTIKLEHMGPFSGTEEDIMQLIEKNIKK